MTALEKAIKDLAQIKTFCSAGTLESVDYVLEILQKLKDAGISEPLNEDFSSIK